MYSEMKRTIRSSISSRKVFGIAHARTYVKNTCENLILCSPRPHKSL